MNFIPFLRDFAATVRGIGAALLTALLTVTPHTIPSPSVDWWLVVERSSWVVVIAASVIGVPFAYIQLRLLRRDQKRIADDLARRPELDVGFLPVKKVGKRTIPAKTMVISPTWKPGQERSEPVRIHIACCNNGDRTARDLLYNISWQGDFDFGPPIQSQVEHTARNPITGSAMFVSEEGFIHPNNMSVFETGVGVLKGRKNVNCHVEVSYDYGTFEVDLSLTVE